MQQTYYKMDLHIHTPASSCYEGAKEDDEYIRILEKAKDKQLNIIAITDHNTINGYEKMIGIKNKLITERDVLIKYLGDDQTNQYIETLNNKIELFEKIEILPGVEITLNPGIHIIVIANPKNVIELSRLLEEVGYLPNMRGKDSEFLPQMDVAAFLNNSLLIDKLVIAPHVDSDKGIYNNLNGRYRAEIFKSNKIKAITCNAPNQLQKIQSLLFNEPTYKRDIPLAYINASDAHNLDLIGSKVSYINLDIISFEEILHAFEKPDEFISDISEPNIILLIKNIVDNEKVVFLEEVNKDKEICITQALCACLNCNIPYLILGVNSEKLTLSGIKMNQDDVDSLIDSAIKKLCSWCNRIIYSSTVEILGNGRSIAIINFPQFFPALWYFKESEDVYIFEDEVKKAKVYDIEKLVQNNTLEGIKKHENANLSIDKVITSLEVLRNPVEKYIMTQSIEKSSMLFLALFSLEKVKISVNSAFLGEQKLEDNAGEANGNLFYVYPMENRYNDRILRYTCPSLKRKEELEIGDLKDYSGFKIIVLDKGGVYLAKGEKWNVVPFKEDLLLLSIRDNFADKISEYSILGWLKSSLFIWYINRKCNSTNLYEPRVINNLYIPFLKCLLPQSNVDKYVQEIIALEEDFLTKTNFKELCENCPCDDCDSDECQANVIVDDHNEKVAELTYKIDCEIFEELQLSDEQIKIISKEIENLGFYNIIV
jgi:hypothetical protein